MNSEENEFFGETNLRNSQRSRKMLPAAAGLVASLMLSATANAESYLRDKSGASTYGAAPAAEAGWRAKGYIKPLVTVAPKYPIAAKKDDLEGWVVLKFDIDQHGKPYNLQAVDNSGTTIFDRSAKEAVKKYRFEPTIVNGRTVPVQGYRYRVVYAFLSD